VQYFADPTPPRPSTRPTDDPLASGLTEFLALATPAALAMASRALDYIQQCAPPTSPEAGAPPTPTLIQAVLSEPGRAAELETQIYQTAREYLLPRPTAHEMSRRLVRALEDLADEARLTERVLNAWVADLPAGAALVLQQTYQLCFEVAAPRGGALVAAAGVEHLAASLAPQEQIAIRIVVESDDLWFEDGAPQQLLVPHSGPSNTVRFVIRPVRAGTVVLTALCFVRNNLFQKLQISLSVVAGSGDSIALPAYLYSGIALESALRLAPARAPISLIILQRGTGYRVIAEAGGRQIRAFLNLSPTHLAELNERARSTLRAVVHWQVGQQPVFQRVDTAIPEPVYRQTLRELAELGAELYDTLFYSSQSADAREMGRVLSELMQSHQFHIKVIAEQFIFPWNLLYPAEDLVQVDPLGFWGMRHQIACMPEFSLPEPIHFTPQIDVLDQLEIGFVCNDNLDARRDAAVRPVQQQLAFLKGLPGTKVTTYPNRHNLLELLADSEAPHQILYFYCHAVSSLPDDPVVPGEPRGVACSRLIVSDGEVSLLEMGRRARTRLRPFRRAPLVFLNACESAELSPYLYDGLVPYLIGRGARAVLGTEADTPIFFSAEFAQELLRRFCVAQEPLGDILLDLRRWYALERRNLLGLLYTLYGSCDLRLNRRAS
jgi:hypothetical protein